MKHSGVVISVLDGERRPGTRHRLPVRRCSPTRLHLESSGWPPSSTGRRLRRQVRRTRLRRRSVLLTIAARRKRGTDRTGLVIDPSELRRWRQPAWLPFQRAGSVGGRPRRSRPHPHESGLERLASSSPGVLEAIARNGSPGSSGTRRARRHPLGHPRRIASCEDGIVFNDG